VATKSTTKAAAKKKAVTKAAGKKVAAKKAASKKVAAKKTAKKKVVAKATAKKKATAAEAAPKKKVAKKTAAKKVAAKTTAKKTASKVAAKKTAAKKTASKKVAAKKVAEKKTDAASKKKAASKAEPKVAKKKASKPPSIPVGEPVVTTVVPYEREKNSHYMDSDQLVHFRHKLAEWKQQLMEEVDRTVGHMKDDATNFPDPNDRATQEEEFSLELRTRDRERKLIKKINEAVKRIEENEYGYCETCGVEIGVGRLEARPTAELCIDCKTLEEIREKQIA